MSDIESSNYSETAASNTASPPDGAPENMARSAVNDTMREMMAGTKREWNRSHPTITSAGTEPAFTLTYTTAPAAYVQGQVFTFKAHASPTGSVTANVNSLGAKKVYDKAGSAQLGSGAWAINTRVQLSYDSALDSAAGGFVWLNQGQVYTAGSGVTISSNAVAVDINGLTEDASPDSTADFVPSYDASATANKKIKISTLLGLAAVPSAATQAQQETASSTSVYVSPGRQQFHPSAAKAWCLFDGTGTPAVTGTPYNVSSITDNGTGDHTVNWTTSFSSANYCVVTANNGYTGVKAVTTCIRALAAGSVRVMTQQLSSDTVSAVDLTQICVAAFGDQ